MTALIAKAATLETEMLKDMAAKLVEDFQDGAGEVFDAVLSVLMDRMGEEEYVDFCDSL